MKTSFSTSVNIIRDKNRDIGYIPTPNSVHAANLISSDFKKGIHSFVLIGSYGTGKSSFLWAYEQSLTGASQYFNTTIAKNKKVDIVSFVGEYRSIIDTFADYFETGSDDNKVILAEIYNRYHDSGESDSLLVIAIDEFGKFLEYAAQHEPEKELYFIQQLSELINNPAYHILLLATVHQNFDAYTHSLSNTQRLEWSKVKGRFKEITFNEPVEQLLFLAAEHLDQSSFGVPESKSIKKSFDLCVGSKVFKTNPDYLEKVSAKLFPLDVFSANSLTLSLQRYGQNERSLFTFLEATDYTGLYSQQWQQHNPFYNLACAYDYLAFNLYSYLNSSANQDSKAWISIKDALENAERTFDKDTSDYLKIIKTIGLLNLTADKGSVLTKEFLIQYAKLCLGINNAGRLIDELEKKTIIFYRKFSKRYILFEGTDVDISFELTKAENEVGEIHDVVTLLNKYFQFPLVFTKKYSYETGTPRFFQYVISEYPITRQPEGEIDGFINLVFNENISADEVQEVSLSQDEAILYGYYTTSGSIKKLLFEMEATKLVIQEQEIANDKIALKELNRIFEHQKNLLTHKILDSFYSGRNEVAWLFEGAVQTITSKRDFNQLLSRICHAVYSYTPVFNNELVNKHKISASIHTAKRYYIKALVNNWDKPQIGFPKDRYPPEKTIYISLLENNGIHLYADQIHDTVAVNNTNRFHFLWNASVDFLNSARLNRKSITDFIVMLSAKPFKLKQGFIDFWIASFLFIKRNDFALFSSNSYIPYITDETLELVIKEPHNYEIKTFAIEGVKLDIFNSYRLLLQQETKEKLSNDTFIETIKPFITFYNGLPFYSRKTKRLNPPSLLIREAITKAKDPEQTFFEDFPSALGYSEEKLQQSSELLQEYILQLQEAIRELRTSYDELIIRLDEFVQHDIVGKPLPFADYKQELQNRYKKLKKHLLLQHQRMFVQQLYSEIDDNKAWLNSIAITLLGKSLEQIQDEEEFLFYDRFTSMIFELDSLTALSQTGFSETNEDIIGIEISTFLEGVKRKMVRLPKSKKAEVDLIKMKLQQTLSTDRMINIAALTNALNELFTK